VFFYYSALPAVDKICGRLTSTKKPVTNSQLDRGALFNEITDSFNICGATNPIDLRNIE